MTSDVRKHLPHYLILAGMMMVSLVLFAYFRSNTQLLQFIVVGTSLGYVIWGIGHHKSIGDLSLEITMEYLLVALLVSALVNAVLLQR